MNTMYAGGTGLTAEQTDFYRDEGYLVLNGLLNNDDLAGAQEAMEQKVEEIAR